MDKKRGSSATELSRRPPGKHQEGGSVRSIPNHPTTQLINLAVRVPWPTIYNDCWFTILKQFFESLLHLLKCNIGSGMMAMGDAFKNAGLFAGIPFTLFLGISCVYSQHMLLSCTKVMQDHNNLTFFPDFAHTVELCFAEGPAYTKKYSKLMRKTVDFFIIITQLGFCSVYFVFVSSTTKQVCDYYGLVLDIHLHLVLIFFPICLSALIRNLKFLAPLSFVSNILMIIGISITLYISSQDLPPVTDRPYLAKWEQIPLFFGTTIYAFEGIGLVLPIQNEMKNAHHFAAPCGVLNIGMTIVSTLLITVGFIGYLKYGEAVEGTLSLNLPQDDVLSQCVKLALALGILLTYSLMFYVPISIIWPKLIITYGAFKHPKVWQFLLRVSLVLLTFVLAEIVPKLGLFISLVGSVSSTALSLVFPPLCDMALRSCCVKFSYIRIAGDIFILVLALVGLCTGTYYSIAALVHAFNEDFKDHPIW